MRTVRIDDLSRLATAAGRLSVVEEAGVLGGGGLLIVEGSAVPSFRDVDVEATAAYLRDVPAVTLLATPVATTAWPAAAQVLVDAFDIVTDDSAEIAAVERAVEAAPLGAYALVALTRVSAALPAAAGLWAESANI